MVLHIYIACFLKKQYNILEYLLEEDIMKRYISVIIVMLMFLNINVFAASDSDEDEVRPLFVVEVGMEKIANIRLEFDVLGIVQKVSPIPTPSSSIKLKKSNKGQVNLATRVPSVFIKNKILKALSKIDSNKISRFIATAFDLDRSSRRKIRKFIKDNLELTPSQLADAFLGINGVLNYNGTDIIIHMGFENIGNYIMENILDGILLEGKKE